MKKHIVRVIAIVTATLMLLSIIPAAALQELSLPNLMSAVTDSSEIGSADASVKDSTAQNSKEEENVQGDVVVDNDDYDFAADVTLGKDFTAPTLNATGPDMATNDGLEANGMVNKSYSPYEPYYTELEDHPFLPYGSAWMDLSKIYYGAPATQNFPFTKWSANTSVYNITGTGDTWASGGAAGMEKFVFPDKDLIDGYTWANYASDTRLKILQTNANGTPKTDSNGAFLYYDNYEHGVVATGDTYHGVPLVASVGSETAYAYNRYDAMQGKYGITLDKNVKSVAWEPSYRADFYDSAAYFGSVVYLSDTPYLYFSTEATDSKKLAISILIGTPIQEEVLAPAGDKLTRTAVSKTTQYEYRWYTITDNIERPGVGNDTRDNSMMPHVTVSDVVATVTGTTGDGTGAFAQQNSAVVPAVYNAGYGDPIALATEKGVPAESLFVDGAITGCIDFSNLLPTIMSYEYTKTVNGVEVTYDGGREDTQFKVAQIRVDTVTAEGAENTAARINYLYFGPSLVTNFTPQTTVGAEFHGQAWQYAQTDAGVGNDTTAVGEHKVSDAAAERAYTSGWENGAAVSVVNTPNDPNLLTVDIYGKGDGELISWDNVPAGANVLRGNHSTNDSMVWKFTDNNDVVQYMEAQLNTVEHSGIDNSYYVMVTVPVRKWINVLGESRKISLNATLLHEGTQFPDAHLKPTFVLWGNEKGAVGPGHNGTGFGARFRGEDLVMVFATAGQTYHTDQGQDYVAAEVDRTIGDSLMYNAPGGTNESWFDVLRSPYTYGETVTGANADLKVTEDHIGYTFITSLRFTMPVGSAISIQNMKGDGNSAGLNAYSTTGHIVSAYDGGSGVQPEINVSGTLPEKKVTITKTGTGNTPADFTYTQSTQGDGSIKGAISTNPAAYGPMLEQSFYTIYDLLDTERLRSSGKESHNLTELGKNKQPIYGEVWLANEDLTIYHIPSTSGAKYGHVYGGSQYVVYGTVIRTDSSRNKWGLVGVLTKNAGTEIGWVLIYNGSTKTATSSRLAGVPYFQDVEVSGDTAVINQTYGKNIVSALKNEWIISDFASIDSGADFRDGTNTNFEYTSDFINNSTNAALGGEKYNPGQNIVSKGYNGPQLKYANKWTGGRGHYSCAYSLQDFYFRSVNGTDLEWGFNRNVNAGSNIKNISMAMTRVFDQPIRLKQGKTHIHSSFPVLYLDYTATTAFKIGISLRVDGADKIWYVDDSYIAHEKSELNSGTDVFKYLSFEDIMTKDYKNASLIEVMGISLYMWNDTSVSSGNVLLRRCEIWQEETDWLDEIIADNQSSGGNSSTAMNCVVKDSMNIINDSFFHYHNENADGSITVAKKGDYASGTNIGVNNLQGIRGYEYTHTDNTQSKAMDFWEGGVHYQYTRTESYRKSNSNKGWSAYIRLDTTKDGVVDGNDETYRAYDAPAVDGVYEYRTSLGHLRVWVPSQTQASVVFESDRSFNTKNYKYLYYSYSMRDHENGISSEENDTVRDDGLKPGIAVAIKSSQLGSGNSYSEIVTGDGTRTWAYYDASNAYWAEDGRDNRTFKTTINAALDLSTLDGIHSVNQFVFYLDNPFGTAGDGDKAEFYINYLYLSNVPPSQLITDQINETQYQYYYMMDNTGDRYSARFPTIDNPTGQVSGLNSDNDRVNPIKVERGQYLAYGTYFNGEPISHYGDGDRTWNEDSGSLGYYEKDYNGETPMKNIMFYAGGNPYDPNHDKDITDIKDYYDYKEMNGDGVADIYDMKWSYGRWDDGAGDAGINTMYVDPNVDGVSGNLTRRFATENYVLLRAGIVPKKYLTYFDAQGGQMKYDTSSDDIKDGVILNDNNYYITETAVFDYFKGPKITAEEATNVPTKYGFIFDGWIHDSSVVPDDKGKFARLYKYTKKAVPGLNYFQADWQDDPAFDGVVHTATFMDPNHPGKVWYTRDVNRDDHEFQMLMPDMLRATVNGKSVHVRGWRIQGEDDGVVYLPGSSVTITDDVTFEAVTENIVDGYDNSAYTHSVTVQSGVELKLVRDLSNLNDLGDPAALGIKKAGNTYYNIPHGTVVALVPTSPKSGYGWTLNLDADGWASDSDTKQQAICGTNNALYKFSVLSDVDIKYSSLANIMDLDSGSAVQSSVSIFTTAAETTVNTKNMYGREMKFYTQFDLSNISGAELVCYGTLYTKSGANYDSIKAALNTQMRLDETTITDSTVRNGAFATLTSAVRQVKATQDAANSSNQYYLMVTENKGNAVTYYARGYVIYKLNGQYNVAYSDTVARSEVEAASNLTDDAL